MHKSMTFVLIGLLLAGLAAAQVPTQSTAALEAAEDAFGLRPGVVVDGGRIYAMHPEGGVDALSMTSGAVEWHSDAAQRPLGMYGELLASQAGSSPAGTMSVVFLGASGSNAGDLAIGLAPGVLASPTDSPRGTFDASMRMDGGQPVFEWQNHAMRFGATKSGNPEPSPVPGGGNPALAAVRSDSPVSPVTKGAVRISPSSGAQSVVASSAPSFDPAARDAAAARARRLVPGATSWLSSADGRHLLISEHVPGADAWLQYSWSIFDQETEVKLGEVASRLGGARFFIRGNLLIFESSPYTLHGSDEVHGLELHAIDLSSGNVVWVREIRDTKYTGPYPS